MPIMPESRKCNELPGHSRCKKKIDGGRCPACDSKSENCVGKKLIAGADVTKAEEWIKQKK